MGIHAHTQPTVKRMETSGSAKKSEGLVGTWKCHTVVVFVIVFGKLVRGSVNGIWCSAFTKLIFYLNDLI
jgi:hypothetical protein